MSDSKPTGAKKQRCGRQRRSDQLSGNAIVERAAEARRQRDITRRAARLQLERDELEEEEAVLAAKAAAGGSGLRQSRRFLARWRDALQGRELRLLERNDEVVREVIARKGQLQAVFSAEGALEGDELLWFVLEHLDLKEALETLVPPATWVDESGQSRKRRRMFPPLVMNLLGVLARYLNLRDGAQVQDGLLTDERWMQLCGFSMAEVQAGVTARSIDRVGMTRDEAHRFVEADDAGPVRARPQTVRGALSSQTLAQWEQNLEPEKLAEFFNVVTQMLVKKGFFGKKVRGVLDSTLLEVSPSFEGAGEASRSVKVKSKARRPVARKVLVRGFKLWVLMDAESRLPLAFALDTIEKPENRHVKDLVAQARENLGKHGELVSLILDRGFMDGDLLWWLEDTAKLEWLVPAKAHMHVHAEALERCYRVLDRKAEPGETRLQTARRLARSGKAVSCIRFIERDGGSGHAPLVVAEVPGLQETDFYCPGGTSSSRANSKSFTPTPLYGTVVLSWPDRRPKADDGAGDQDDEAGKPLVILSSRAHPGLRRYRWYDDRSLIENGVFRDAKQHFALGTSLARNRAALESASVFSLVALMLDRALREHTDRLLERSDRRAEQLGVLRYRRQLEHRNRGKIIIVAADCFTVLPLSEFIMLAGFPGGAALL